MGIWHLKRTEHRGLELRDGALGLVREEVEAEERADVAEEHVRAVERGLHGAQAAEEGVGRRAPEDGPAAGAGRCGAREGGGAREGVKVAAKGRAAVAVELVAVVADLAGVQDAVAAQEQLAGGRAGGHVEARRRCGDGR